MWHSPLSGRYFSIPSNISSRHLANQILKEAGLPKRAVRKYHNSLTIDLRREIYTDLCKAIRDGDHPKLRVNFDTFVVLLRPILHEIDKRIVDIQAARNSVQFDSNVRGGEPTVSNTRIPVYMLQELVVNGAARREIAIEYELTPRQVDLALLYAELHPRRGRPARTGLDDDLPDFVDVARVDVEDLGEFGNRDLPIA
jgi:uncharacterized protein (DUF433 family)